MEETAGTMAPPLQPKVAAHLRSHTPSSETGLVAQNTLPGRHEPCCLPGTVRCAVVAEGSGAPWWESPCKLDLVPLWLRITLEVVTQTGLGGGSARLVPKPVSRGSFWDPVDGKTSRHPVWEQRAEAHRSEQP